MATSKVVYLLACEEEESDPALLPILLEGGWQVLKPNPESLGFSDPSAGHCNVGIVCIPSADPAWLARLYGVIRKSGDVSWIAIIRPGIAANERVREFIAVHCVDYQTEPLEPARVLFALGHAAGMAHLAAPPRRTAPAGGESIIGRSPAMDALRHDLSRLAQVDAPVLITGESGTGKELVAGAIHQLSQRRDQPFIVVNCISLAPSLIHAELFGHEKGAFTGAHQRRVGHLEAAHHGTILLDEIGDLQPELQAMLLRFIEQKAVRRVGGRGEIAVDARVIAATNVDLESAVREGWFREDLYYRLNVLRMRIPPLRERREDIEPLANAFLQRFIAQHRQGPRGFSKAALSAMMSYDWPGNVRELLNRVIRAGVMVEGRWITPADLHFSGDESALAVPNLEIARGKVERETVLAALHRTHWSPSECAKLLGVSRATFYRLLTKYTISVNDKGTFVEPQSRADMLGSDPDSA